MSDVACHCPPARPQKSSVFGLLATFVALRRHRHHLLSLDPRILDDIGISAEAAQTEAARPFWDVPPNWRA